MSLEGELGLRTAIVACGSGRHRRRYKAKPLQALHTCSETPTATGIRQASAAHMWRAADIQHAFGLDFARTKEPKQPPGEEGWRACGVTWGAVLLFACVTASLWCKSYDLVGMRALGAARDVTLGCHCRTQSRYAVIGME